MTKKISCFSVYVLYVHVNLTKIHSSVACMSLNAKASILLTGDKSDFSFSAAVVAACFGPPAMYVLLYGSTLHFMFLFLAVIMFKVFVLFDLNPTSKSITQTVGSRMFQRPTSKAVPGPISVRESKRCPMESPRVNQQRNALPRIPVPPATQIVSADDAVTKTRRSLLNKVSPDKLDDITAKLTQTFNLYSEPSILKKDAAEFFSLLFAAVSRQPEYVFVFTELVDRISQAVLDCDLSEDLLINQAQLQWSSICLTPVEKTKSWETLIDEQDKQDARARHKAKQLAISEFCGLLASANLIPPSFPLTWLESLMRPIVASTQSRIIANPASLENAVEIVCRGIRGLGQCESRCLFTDMDSVRFGVLCRTIGSLQTVSSRVRCLIQDIIELRESGWSKLPSWKKAMQPAKRLSSTS